MTPRGVLRALTRAEHAAVDQLFLTFDLSEATGYRSFLMAQGSAHIAIEDALEVAGAARVLDDWPGRRRGDLLRADLAEIGPRPLHPVPPPAFRTDAEILGGIYVLEGSRLGGAVLSRKVAADAPTRFLAGPSFAGAWRSVQALLDRRLDSPSSIDAAVEAARACFRCFELAGRLELEPARG